MEDVHEETSKMVVEKEHGFQLKGFNEMQKRATAVNVRDRTSLKYLPSIFGVQSYMYVRTPIFNPRIKCTCQGKTYQYFVVYTTKLNLPNRQIPR